MKWHILQPSAPHFTNITGLLTIASPDGRGPFLLGPPDYNPTVVRGQMRIFRSPHFLVFCLVQVVKWVAAVVIHDDGMVNVALTEATLPPSRRHPLHRMPIAATSDPSSRPAFFLNHQQELSIVFHQDWRQILGQGQGIGGGGIVYFYSNGSSTANRGAEVGKCRSFCSTL